MRVQRPSSGSVRAAGAATVILLAWHVVESVNINPNYLAYSISWQAVPHRGTSTWPIARWTGGRTCRRSSDGSTARDCSRQARAACTCPTSARRAPSTTGSRPLRWRASSTAVHRRRPSPSVAASTASAPPCSTSSAACSTNRRRTSIPGALKNVTIFVIVKRAEPVGVDGANGRAVLAAAVRPIRSVEDGTTGGLPSPPSTRRHDRVSILDLPADRCRCRPGGERSRTGRLARLGTLDAAILSGSDGTRKEAEAPPTCARSRHFVERAAAAAKRARGRLLGADDRPVSRSWSTQRAWQRLRPGRGAPHSRQRAHPVARERPALFASSLGSPGTQGLYRPMVLASYTVNYAITVCRLGVTSSPTSADAAVCW